MIESLLKNFYRLFCSPFVFSIPLAYGRNTTALIFKLSVGNVA